MFKFLKKIFRSRSRSRPLDGIDFAPDSSTQPSPKTKKLLSKCVTPDQVLCFIAIFDRSAAESPDYNDTDGATAISMFEEFHDPLTICTSKAQLAESIDQLLYLRHFDHYYSWCSLHNCPPFTDESWRTYRDKVIGGPEAINNEFIIQSYFYTPDQLASIFRTFSCCPYLGLAHQNEFESFVSLDPAYHDVALSSTSVFRNSSFSLHDKFCEITKKYAADHVSTKSLDKAAEALVEDAAARK